jgi:hypothetical protein
MDDRIWYYLGRDEGGGKPRLLEDFDSLGDAISWAASWSDVDESEIDHEQVLKTLDKHGVWRLGNVWIKEMWGDESDE